MSVFIEALQQFISQVILTCFLTILFIASLWHNFITVHFKKQPDPRDIRKSSTNIKPKKKAGHTKRFSRNSFSSLIPIEIEEDEENNIEYDHTITSGNTVHLNSTETNIIASVPKSEAQNHHDTSENPFTNLLSQEDRKLVPDLKYYYKQYNIDIEEFEIETDDGFIIDLWHLVPLQPQTEEVKRHPVLMVHGLLQSSGAFASPGRKSLTYYLFKSGFDIWLGNNRCGLKAKWNKKNLKNKHSKWDWDLEEMVKFDLKAMVEKVLLKTGYEKLTMIAHSQGTTQGLYGLINGEKLYKDVDFKLIDKLENFIALAPAIYPGPLLDEKPFVRFMAMGIDVPWVFGTKSFIPLMMLMRSISAGTKPFSFFSYIMFNYLFDWNDSLWDKVLRDRNFLFSPVHISVKLMQWWLSPDSGKISFKNGSSRMFPTDRTWFPIESHHSEEVIHLNSPRPNSSHYPRLMIFIPRQDRLVDGERLINHFINNEANALYKIWYIDEYSHLDVLWAHDVIERIGKPIVDHIRLMPETEL